MNRRTLIKNLGIGLIVGGGAGLALKSCAKKEDEEIEKKIVETPNTNKNPLIVNRYRFSFKDPNNPTEYELKHTPDITIKGTEEFKDVTITLGLNGIVHPTTDNHWIDYISLFKNKELIGKTEFEAGYTKGFIVYSVKLKKGDKLRAESGCNLHGIWENTVEYN